MKIRERAIGSIAASIILIGPLAPRSIQLLELVTFFKQVFVENRIARIQIRAKNLGGEQTQNRHVPFLDAFAVECQNLRHPKDPSCK